MSNSDSTNLYSRTHLNFRYSLNQTSSSTTLSIITLTRAHAVEKIIASFTNNIILSACILHDDDTEDILK